MDQVCCSRIREQVGLRGVQSWGPTRGGWPGFQIAVVFGCLKQDRVEKLLKRPRRTCFLSIKGEVGAHNWGNLVWPSVAPDLYTELKFYHLLLWASQYTKQGSLFLSNASVLNIFSALSVLYFMNSFLTLHNTWQAGEEDFCRRCMKTLIIFIWDSY